AAALGLRRTLGRQALPARGTPQGVRRAADAALRYRHLPHLRRVLVWRPRDGFTASADPGPAAGVLAPPSCGVGTPTPRRSSLRLPASAPGSAGSLRAPSRPARRVRAVRR